MYVKRNIEEAIISSAKLFPVITVTGPRQSGKTTLVRNIFNDKPYFNLELPDVHDSIQQDPRAFFNKLENGAVIDEIQRLPELIRYIQGIVDEKKQPGLFVLTGSNQFLLLNKINESLAGRVALFKLLPFSLSELSSKSISVSTDELILKGLYPAVQVNNFPAYQTYQNYYETYLERDLRNLLNIKDLSSFKKFVSLCAGRTAQILNTASLSNETGVSANTIKSWLSILEASYVLFLLQPWYDNISKRLVKSPKIYFYDTGLASYLLGIENQNQLSRDPLRGNLFENMIVAEYFK
ncbi:MAG: ATP-binding protein, partial [Chlorobi bacterium]|nr:ATP-binding protein [Chlorobiota bacterium]